MDKKALLAYQNHSDLDRKPGLPPIVSAGNYDCHNCLNCRGCSHCFACRNAEGLKYAFCNIEIGETDWKKRMRQLEVIK